jgi:hypothetical protein
MEATHQVQFKQCKTIKQYGSRTTFHDSTYTCDKGRLGPSFENEISMVWLIQESHHMQISNLSS